MKLQYTQCPLCGNKRTYRVLLEQNFTTQQISTDIFSARRLPDRLHYRMVSCSYDGMVRSNPILESKDLQTLYMKSKFTYDQEVENLNRSYMRCLLPILKELSPNDRILEIGCGNGFLLESLQELGFKRIVGVEPSTDAVSKASRLIRKKILIQNFRKNLFEKGTFSFIFLFQTLDHIPSPDLFLQECVRILKPGGYILSFHHNIDSISAKLLGAKSPIFDVEHTQLFSFKTSASLFEKAKLTVNQLYAPKNTLSLKHLLWLFPIPKLLKAMVLSSKSAFLSVPVTLSLGNICIVGQKRTL